MIKTCPICKGIVHYNSHFKAYMCLSNDCTWMQEDVKKDVVRYVARFSSGKVELTLHGDTSEAQGLIESILQTMQILGELDQLIEDN